MRTLAVFLFASFPILPETSPLEDAIVAARGGATNPEVRARIAKAISAAQGVIVWGQDYLFVATSPSPVTISINQLPPVSMAQIPE
jgi:hypothetical protein